MNADHFEALVIDHSLGELPADVAALLEAYLAAHPEQAREAERIREAVGLAGKTLERHPELLHDSGEAATSPELLQRFAMLTSFLQTRAALASLAMVLAGLIGFFLGQNQTPPEPTGTANLAAVEEPSTPERNRDSPWARYSLEDLEPGLAAVVTSLDLSSKGDTQ